MRCCGGGRQRPSFIPAGGKRGLRAFVQGRLSTYLTPPEYVVFQDRDFDREPPGEAALIPLQAANPVFLSYRAAVENYLLDAGLIHRYWDENGSRSPKWQHGDSPGEDAIRQWMDEAAKEIACYEAVRWALASLKPSERWPEVSTTWTEGSGDLPMSLGEDQCLAEAKRLVARFRKEVAEVSEAKLLESYERFSQQFSSPEFVARSDYLIWFQGKDLQKAMQKLRPHSISLRHFLDWAVDRSDWQQHADLRQLSSRL